jgi:hypothetical protein
MKLKSRSDFKRDKGSNSDLFVCSLNIRYSVRVLHFRVYRNLHTLQATIFPRRYSEPSSFKAFSVLPKMECQKDVNFECASNEGTCGKDTFVLSILNGSAQMHKALTKYKLTLWRRNFLSIFSTPCI